ncbi:MAG: PEGA domain-containing protein [Fibrobacterales bacterium]
MKHRQKDRTVLRKLLFFVLIIQLLAFADDFSIKSFNAVDAGEPDKYITAPFSSELKKVKSGKIQKGKFYVRHKFEDPYDPDAITYQLFEGQPSSSIGTLSKFKIPKGMNIRTFVKKKFYLSDYAEFDEDIETVYFDKKYAYVEKEETLYIKNGGSFKTLGFLDEKICYIEVTSEPSGATVKVDGKSKGITPVKFSVISTKPILATIKKKGYYTISRSIKPNPNSLTQDGLLLISKKEMENPVPPHKALFKKLTKKPDYDTLKILARNIKKSLKELPELLRDAKSNIETNYPANPPKGSSESKGNFGKRSKSWKKNLKNELIEQDKKAKTYKAELKKLLKKVNKAKEGFRALEKKRLAKEARAEKKRLSKEKAAEKKRRKAEAAQKEKEQYTLLYTAIDSKNITLGKYRRGTYKYSISMDQSPFQFNYSGRFRKGRVNKDELLESLDEVTAVLKYWNVETEDGYFKALHGVDLYYQGKKFKTSRRSKGKFTYSESDSHSKKLLKKFKAKHKKRLKNRSRKKAFYKEDIQKSKEALELFESGKGPKNEPSIKETSDKLIEKDSKDIAQNEEKKEEFKESFEQMDELYEDSDVPFYTAIALGAVSVGTGYLAYTYYDQADKAKASANVVRQAISSPDGKVNVDGVEVSDKNELTEVANELINEHNDKNDKFKLFGIISGLSLTASIVLFTF